MLVLELCFIFYFNPKKYFSNDLLYKTITSLVNAIFFLVTVKN